MTQRYSHISKFKWERTSASYIRPELMSKAVEPHLAAINSRPDPRYEFASHLIKRSCISFPIE
jgi:hypothetical protein